MGSVGNSNPWSPFQSYRDCSQGLCSIYCPQWCYIILSPPPPPSFAIGDTSTSFPFDLSPLIVALIGILLTAFIIIAYFTLIVKYSGQRTGNNDIRGVDSDDQINSESAQSSSSSGLDEALIKSIRVCKYKKNNGSVEETDYCSVCLSEFQENESVRILPKCSHPFHLPCIDTWLISNSSCPLCRSSILPTNILPVSTHQTQPPGLNISPLETQNFQEAIVVEVREDGFEFQAIRRCVSMNSCSIDEESLEMGIGSSKEDRKRGVLNLAKNRSISNV